MILLLQIDQGYSCCRLAVTWYLLSIRISWNLEIQVSNNIFLYHERMYSIVFLFLSINMMVKIICQNPFPFYFIPGSSFLLLLLIPYNLFVKRKRTKKAKRKLLEFCFLLIYVIYLYQLYVFRVFSTWFDAKHWQIDSHSFHFVVLYTHDILALLALYISSKSEASQI